MYHLRGVEPGALVRVEALCALLCAPGCCLRWLPLLAGPSSQPVGLGRGRQLGRGFLLSLHCWKDLL